MNATGPGRIASTPYDRDVLVEVLVYHWPTSTSGCGCGWGVLGASHPKHIAEVYEESVALRAPVSDPDIATHPGDASTGAG